MIVNSGNTPEPAPKPSPAAEGVSLHEATISPLNGLGTSSTGNLRRGDPLRRIITTALLQSDIYRSWSDFMSRATQQDGTPFSERSRAQLQASGSAFLIHLLLNAWVDESGNRTSLKEVESFPGGPAAADKIIREKLMFLSSKDIEQFIRTESGTTDNRKAQLRSMLRLNMRPWVMEQKLSDGAAFPQLETPHQAEQMIDRLELTEKLTLYLERVVAEKALSPESASNVMRIYRRFTRAVFDITFPATESVPPEIAEFKRNLIENFDTLVEKFSSSQTISTLRNTTRSALLRHVRPLAKPHALPLVQKKVIRSQKEAKNAISEGNKTSSPLGQAHTEKASPDAVRSSPEKTPSLDELKVPEKILPPSPEEYHHLLEKLIGMFSTKLTISRSQLARVRKNDVRVIGNEIRVLVPPLTEKTPTQWRIFQDPDLFAAVGAYLTARRAMSKTGAQFFATYEGESIVQPAASKKKGKR